LILGGFIQLGFNCELKVFESFNYSIFNFRSILLQNSTKNQIQKGKNMDKALEIGKTSATGSFHLFIGVTASTIIMAVGTIILARLMTPEEYGLYSIALIPSYMMILFRDWGVNSAIIKYIATLRAQGKQEHTLEIIRAGIIFEIITGLALSLLSVFISSYIASTIFQRPESSSLIAITSITIFAGALLAASQSSFIGFERMELNSLTTICQAIVKSIVSPLLVFIGYSALGAVMGYTISFLTAALIGLAILYLTIIRNLKAKNPEKPSILKTLKKMLHYGFPLSISAIISGFLAQFYAFLMVIYCTDAMIGNYQAATQFATILTFFTIPISTVLFPAFSKINQQEEHELLQTLFTSSVKYTAMLLVPATMAMMVLSKPMISTLFGEKWAYAPFFLTLYVTGNLFSIFGSSSLGSLLAGLGETKVLMKLSLITLTFGIPLAFFLIPAMEIVGLILTSITAGIPSMLLGLYWIWKRHKAKADLKSSIRILMASAIASTTTYLILNVIASVDWIELAAGGATFLATYLITTPLIGAINQSDINNLKVMFSGLGIISKLLNIPLVTMEKLSRVL
jgi:O-antigen/teichoic acid export membrane protein